MRRMLTSAAIALALTFGAAALAMRQGWWWPTEPDESYVVRGLDVSHHQGEIDWKAVAADGWDFVWIKATEGGDYVDPRYGENVEGARQARIPYGPYHYYTFCRSGSEQARHFLAATSNTPLPPAVDVEFGGNCGTTPTAEDLIAGLLDFLTKIETRRGRPVVLYITADLAQAYPGLLPALTANTQPARPVWVRSVFSDPWYGPWQVWQYCPRGHARGIEGFVDQNAYRGSHTEFVNLISTTGT